MMHTDISLLGRHTPAQETRRPSLNLYPCLQTQGQLLYDQVKVLLTDGQQIRNLYAELLARPFT